MIRMRLAARLAALALLTTMWPTVGRVQAPDTLLLNGKVITLDARSTVAAALAVRDVYAAGPFAATEDRAAP
jgi:hypothetical protein